MRRVVVTGIGIVSSIGNDRWEAVSYTHLDVYKRQDRRRADALARLVV